MNQFKKIFLISFSDKAQAATEAIGYVRQDCAGYSLCYTSLATWEGTMEVEYQ